VGYSKSGKENKMKYKIEVTVEFKNNGSELKNKHFIFSELAVLNKIFDRVYDCKVTNLKKKGE
jgi:hypothetical protein